jgi:voltage-gated sodium channel
MVQLSQRIAQHPRFQQFITAVILAAAVVVGVETYPGMVAEYGGTLHALDKIILGIFCAEIAVKMIALGSKPWRFFKDPWNCFDFFVVAACFMPVDATYVTVLRLARLLRVLRLVRAVPRLQVLVGALLRSIPSMGYVGLLLGLLFYAYGVAATFLFSGNDPIHFGNLQLSMLSLFRAVTLEDWTDLMYIQMKGCAGYGYDGMIELCTQSAARPVLGALFFVSFILIGTMIMLNLFIGVIMNGMSEATAEREADEKQRLRDAGHAPTLVDELQEVTGQLSVLQKRLAEIQRAMAKAPAGAVTPLVQPAAPPDPGSTQAA